MMRCLLGVSVLGAMAGLAGSQASGEPLGPIVQRLPPEGLDIPDQEHKRLTAAAEKLARRLEKVRHRAGTNRFQSLLPDVEIFGKAIDIVCW